MYFFLSKIVLKVEPGQGTYIFPMDHANIICQYKHPTVNHPFNSTYRYNFLCKKQTFEFTPFSPLCSKEQNL